MDDYIAANKAAWEEAFDNRKYNWGDEDHIKLKSKPFAFFDRDVLEKLKVMDFKDKKVAQFCCNNGRELLSLVLDGGAAHGVGFDIAENILGQAKQSAEKAGINNCEFVNCNILDIPVDYYNKFDFLFITLGAICCFKDLVVLFKKVQQCLKIGGTFLLNDGHPFAYMLPIPGQDAFDPYNLNQITYSYFKKSPWVNTGGMYYISGDCESKPFIEFSHTVSDIINAVCVNNMQIISCNEYEYEIGGIGSEIYNNKGIPLSYILTARKV
jgi:ubiquinone/menaquinone biosynthesis C-methylase UbiE